MATCYNVYMIESTVYELNKREVKNEEIKMDTKGHFVQTHVSADVYRALHARSKEQNKTLREFLEELLTSYIRERNYHGKDESNE